MRISQILPHTHLMQPTLMGAFLFVSLKFFERFVAVRADWFFVHFQSSYPSGIDEFDEVWRRLDELTRYSEFGKEMLEHPANTFQGGILCPTQEEIRRKRK